MNIDSRNSRSAVLWCMAVISWVYTLSQAYLREVVGEKPDYLLFVGMVLLISAPLIGGLVSVWERHRDNPRAPVAVIIVCLVMNVNDCERREREICRFTSDACLLQYTGVGTIAIGTCALVGGITVGVGGLLCFAGAVVGTTLMQSSCYRTFQACLLGIPNRCRH